MHLPKNIESIDMVRFLLLIDEKYLNINNQIKFHKLWPVLYHNVYAYEQRKKQDKINRLRLRKQKLANKIVDTLDSKDVNKNHKIQQIKSYIMAIDDTLRKLSR